MSREVPERDWKRLSQIKPDVLNRFCQKILDQAATFASQEGTSHERYGKLYRFLHEEDKKIAEAFNDLRRSNALRKIISMHSYGIITNEELATFSEETRDLVLTLSRSPDKPRD